MMKALSIWQPWASLIGVKLIETRSWPTNYRGQLLICAAKTKNGVAVSALVQREIQRALWPLFHLSGSQLVTMIDLPLGQAVAVVDLVDCLPVDEISDSVIRRELPFGNFSAGRFGWMFENVRRIKPFPVVGRQGLFNVPSYQLIEVGDG